MRTKISIIGVGKVGSTLALQLVMKNLAEEIWLFDSQQDFLKAKTLDMGQSLPLLHSRQNIYAGTHYSDLKDSKIIVITEGQPKSDHVGREDLLVPNAIIVGKIAKQIKKYAPQAIVIVLTNPYDAMTALVLRESGLPRSRVFGSAGMLYASRFIMLLAKKLEVRRADIETIFIGGGSPRFTPIIAETKVRGKPVTDHLSPPILEKLIGQTREAANEIIRLLGDGAAYIAPAAAAATAIEHILKPNDNLISIAVQTQGKYGVDAVLNVPVVLGKKGVKKIVELELSESEKRLLQDAAKHFKNLEAKLPKNKVGK